MNTTQTQTTIAPIVAFLAGLLAGKGVFGFDAATWAAIIGGIGGVVMTIWAAIATRKTTLVSTVNAMDEVAGVVTKNSPAGVDLAEAVPASTVVPAGTAKAIDIAKNGRHI